MLLRGSIRKKIIVLEVLALTNGFGGALAAAYVDRAFIFPAVAVPLACGLATLLLKCPRCKTRAMKRRYRAFNVAWTYWGGFTPPRECSNCGYSFEEEVGESNVSHAEVDSP